MAVIKEIDQRVLQIGAGLRKNWWVSKLKIFSINPKVIYFIVIILIVGDQSREENLGRGIFVLLLMFIMDILIRYIKGYWKTASCETGVFGDQTNMWFRARCFSFPSQHSFTAFQFVSVIPFLFGSNLLYILTPYAILVAFSRILMGHHYLTDVLAGSILGIMSGGFIVILCTNIT